MKLPAVTITATFSSGIALGLHPAIATHPASKQLLLASFLAAVALVFAGMVLVKMGQLFPAAFDSLLCWILLGFLGTCVARLPRPADHVTFLVEQGQLDLKNAIAGSAKNDDSLVLRLHFGNRNVMLPGDAERSKNSTMTEFLAAVHPQAGMISAGEVNPYGHPSPELLERLENAGIRIQRTDRDGAVHVLTDRARIEISCFVAWPDRRNPPASVLAQRPNHDQSDEK
jgi:hypothetical protein